MGAAAHGDALRRSNPLIGARVGRLLQAQMEPVKLMIVARLPNVEAIAATLEKAGTLKGEEVARMLEDGSTLPDRRASVMDSN